jgi:mannose-6-phosphate isomerase-like protein (cupin superfamily)
MVFEMIPVSDSCGCVFRDGRSRVLLIFALVLLILVFSLPAQKNGPAGFNLWSPQSLQPSINEMTAEAPSDPHKFAVRQLADYANDGFLVVHREADGQVEWHETQADVFFVQSGSAVLLLGGRLLNAETVGPHEKRNGTIEGGVRRNLSAGDVVRIPPRVPHQVLLNGSKSFDYFVVKVKGY